jgi:ribosomal-protein-alanine N-acetyltransferase
MSNSAIYSLNRASSAEIAVHLLCADKAFEPILSNRVNIQTYSQKLHTKAVRFEAWINQELVGLVATYLNKLDGKKAFVSNVSVLPKYQGQGIAGNLMRRCVDHAQAIDIYLLELEVDHHSYAALALYRKFGFKIHGISGNTLSMRMKLERKINEFNT